MNANISMSVICFEVIIYLLLNTLHGCTFNYRWKLKKHLMYTRFKFEWLNMKEIGMFIF